MVIMKTVRKRNRNPSEAMFMEIAKARGWEVTRRGYPDFICYTKTGDIILVEVKPRKTCPLKASQSRFMATISKRYGVKCYKWTPEHDWLSK